MDKLIIAVLVLTLLLILWKIRLNVIDVIVALRIKLIKTPYALMRVSGGQVDVDEKAGTIALLDVQQSLQGNPLGVVCLVQGLSESMRQRGVNLKTVVTMLEEKGLSEEVLQYVVQQCAEKENS